MSNLKYLLHEITLERRLNLLYRFHFKPISAFYKTLKLYKSYSVVEKDCQTTGELKLTNRINIK